MKPTGEGRESGFDRLLAREMTRSAAVRGDCPQVEQLAAWFDRALPPGDAEAVEGHVAACRRCQDVLGHLARSEPEVLYVRPRPAPFRWTWHLRWAVPLAAATVVVIVVATRPEQLPRDATGTLPAAPAPVPQGEVARLREPAPAPSRPSQVEGARPKAAASDRGQATGTPEARPMVPAKAEEMAGRPAPPAAPAEAQRGGVEYRALPPAPASTQAEAGRTKAQPAPAAADALPDNAVAAGAARADQPSGARIVIAEKTVATKEADVTQRPAAFGGALGQLSAQAPGGRVLWRYARPGVILRSADAGATWTEHALPGPVRLLALSAASPTVCWAAGRGGALVRTVDGSTWRSVTPPVVADLVWITALDERRASVRTADGVGYDTVDGGATWQPR